jgi:death-on-curing family protein
MIHDDVVCSLWPAQATLRTGYRDRNLLASAAARPFQTALGQEIFASVTEKAAALFHALVANHAFADGNKRTAVLALDHFLMANSVYLAAAPNQMYQIAKAAASYRERGRSHHDILADITNVLNEVTLTFSELRGRPGLQSLYGDLYETVVWMKLHIRRHKLNRRTHPSL